MKIISYFSYKGGAGRSTLAYNTIPLIARNHLHPTKENPIVNKMYKAGQSVIDWTQKGVNFCTNINTGKDVLFKYLCI